MEKARPAQQEDADACTALCNEAVESLRDRRGGRLLAGKDARLTAESLLSPGGLARLIADPLRSVLVGTVDDAVVGFAIGRIDQLGETAIGAVEGLYVDPACRGVGVGGTLLRSLVAWFEASGCGAVDAHALPGDRETKNFFEGLGFKARLITMHLPLG